MFTLAGQQYKWISFFFFTGNLNAPHKVIRIIFRYCQFVCLLFVWPHWVVSVETEGPGADKVDWPHDSLEQIAICCSHF